MRSVFGPGPACMGRKRRPVRIVTLDALPPCLRTLRRVPVAVGPAVRPVLPVAIDRPMTLGTQQLRLIPGDLVSRIVHERVAVGADGGS